ncbi:Auxin-responsive protein SAUR72 [Glycine soja]
MVSMKKIEELHNNRRDSMQMKILKSFIAKVHDGLAVVFAPIKRSFTLTSNDDSATTEVPGDVLEGHFVVLANKGEETKRFIVELHYLDDPAFLGLLERAREEYGFRQKGVLVIPCHPQELEKILEQPRDHESVGGDGGKLTDSIQDISECSAISCSS